MVRLASLVSDGDGDERQKVLKFVALILSVFLLTWLHRTKDLI